MKREEATSAGFCRGGRETGEPGEKPFEQGETQSTYGTGPESNFGHISGRGALSALRQPCSP